MLARREVVVRVVLAILLVVAIVSPARAQNEGVAQYRAAVTKIFLWKYGAMPIFRQNPVFPGTVLRLDNETIRLASARCYAPRQGGKYRAIGGYQNGLAIGQGADLRLQGDLLGKRLAAVEAAIGAKVRWSTAIIVTPLAIDRFTPDLAALRNVGRDSECQLIPRLLSGQEPGYVIAAEVLHGVVQYQIGLTLGASASAGATSQALATIGKIFNLTSAEIGVSANRVSFAVAASPAPQTLAIIPEGFNRAELARITSYLQGKRGADLEIAVAEALAAGDVSVFQRAAIRIRNLLGDEINQKERWAERFVRGEKTSHAQLRTDRERVDFEKLGTYAAAMELVVPPANTR